MTMSDLDNLDGLAAQADAGAVSMDTPPGPDGQGPGTELASVGPDYLTEARGIVDMFAAMVVGYAPKAESVWTDPDKSRTAAALAPVMKKYAFTLGGMPCELALIIVAGPLLWQSSKIVAAQMAEKKAKAAKDAKDAKASQGDTVSDAMVKAAQPAAPTGQPENAPATPVHDQMRLYQR